MGKRFWKSSTRQGYKSIGISYYGSTSKLKKNRKLFIRSLIFFVRCPVVRCLVKLHHDAPIETDSEAQRSSLILITFGHFLPWIALVALGRGAHFWDYKVSESHQILAETIVTGHDRATAMQCYIAAINNNCESNHLICIPSTRNICNKTKLQKISSSTAPSQFTAKNSI